MNRGFTYTDEIDAEAAGETVIEFYARRYPHSDEHEWRARIDDGSILLDGARVGVETLLRRGQILSYKRVPWIEPDAPRTFGVIYEDEDIIVVDKPSGLPVLPGGQHLDNTLLALVRGRFGGEVAPSPLHRLGRGTSGIVLFARRQGALRRLTEAFTERRVTKVYRALVQGTGLPEETTIEVPIGRVEYPPIGTLHAAKSDGAPSTSICRLLHEDREQRCSLVEVRIITGRPHQIRIHMATVGHPLVGDPLYTHGGLPLPLVPGRRAPLPGDCGYRLHATYLKFHHPTTDTLLSLFAPPPPILQTPSETVRQDRPRDPIS